AARAALDRGSHGRLRARRPAAPLGQTLGLCSAVGDGWMWVLGAAALLASRRPLAAMVAAAATAAVTNLLVIVLKTVVRRRRPGRYVRNPFLVAALGRPPDCDRFSFPSGHTANAIALATLLSRAFPAAAVAVFPL